MGIALLLAVLVALIVAVLAVVLLLRGRRRAALAAGAAALVVLAALETVPRLLDGRAVASECLGTATEVELASGSVTGQVLTGGLRGEVRIDAAQVERMVRDRLADSPLAGAGVRLTTGDVVVSGTLPAPIGDLPVEVTLAPEVTERAVGFRASSAEVAGREVPVGALERLTERRATGGCGTGAGTAGPEVLAAEIEPDGMVLTVRR